MRSRSRPFLSLLLSLVGWGLSSPEGIGSEPRRFEFRQVHMASEFKLILYTSDETQARCASDSAFAEVAKLDRILNDYEPTSEINRLSDRAGTKGVSVSPELFDLLLKSQSMSQLSGGAFDPTVKPLVKLWRRAFRQRELPELAELDQARRLVDYRAMRFDHQESTVLLERHGMRLDVGGIAKGYAAQRAIEVLKVHGITSALAAAAGDIVVSDAPPGEPGWKVGIAPLSDPSSTPELFLRLENKAISTSGDAERFAEIGGNRYSHIVDPRTGFGVINRASVTVVSDEGWTSDSLATAVFVLGPEKGLDLIEATAGAAARISRLENGRLQTWVSKRWRELKVD